MALYILLTVRQFLLMGQLLLIWQFLCRHCCLLWFGHAFVVFLDDLEHVFGVAVT